MWSHSEDNWLHIICSMNACSETKAGHATTEENHGTIQKETLHLLDKLGSQDSKVYCRVLSPQSMCSQCDPYYTKTLSNHRHVNEEHSLLHNRATTFADTTLHQKAHPQTKGLQVCYCMQLTDCIPNPRKCWGWSHRDPGSKFGQLPNLECPTAVLSLSSCFLL